VAGNERQLPPNLVSCLDVRFVGNHFVLIRTDDGDHNPRVDALVAVREVVTD
jgi:hypothetical protein